jgi:hypothetical protein
MSLFLLLDKTVRSENPTDYDFPSNIIYCDYGVDLVQKKSQYFDCNTDRFYNMIFHRCRNANGTPRAASSSLSYGVVRESRAVPIG